MRRLLIIFISYFLTLNAFTQEISLYNNRGDAVAYISVSDNYVIFSWSGKPIGYFVESNNLIHFYTFQGKHLGWFENGLIRDHNGDVVLFIRNSLQHIVYNIEKVKGVKELIPVLHPRDVAPVRPVNSLNFSHSPLAFIEGSYSTTGVNSNRTNLTQVKPYLANNDAIMNTFNAALESLRRQQELARAYQEAGYVYDYQSKTWVTLEVKKDLEVQRAKELEEKRANAAKAWDLYNATKNKLPTLKPGKHRAFLVNEYNYLVVDVIVEKNILTGALNVKNIIGIYKDLTYRKNNKVTDRLAKVEFEKVLSDNARHKYIATTNATLLFVFE